VICGAEPKYPISRQKYNNSQVLKVVFSTHDAIELEYEFAICEWILSPTGILKAFVTQFQPSEYCSLSGKRHLYSNGRYVCFFEGALRRSLPHVVHQKGVFGPASVNFARRQAADLPGYLPHGFLEQQARPWDQTPPRVEGADATMKTFTQIPFKSWINIRAISLLHSRESSLTLPPVAPLSGSCCSLFCRLFCIRT
jgi:hypothetical protein